MQIFKKSIVLGGIIITSLSSSLAHEKTDFKKTKEVEIFKEIATWTKENKEAIYDVTKTSFEEPNWGYYTQKEDVIYVLVFDWPVDGKLIIDRAMKVRTAYLNYGAEKLKTELGDGK